MSQSLLGRPTLLLCGAEQWDNVGAHGKNPFLQFGKERVLAGQQGLDGILAFKGICIPNVALCLTEQFATELNVLKLSGKVPLPCLFSCVACAFARQHKHAKLEQNAGCRNNDKNNYLHMAFQTCESSTHLPIR